MDEHIYIQGVALSNYRGIGAEIQYVCPFSRFNFFIGENNSGKSNVLNFLAKHLKLYTEEPHVNDAGRFNHIDVLDIHAGSTEAQIIMAKGVDVESILNKAQTMLSHNNNYAHWGESFFKRILNKLIIKNYIWIVKSGNQKKTVLLQDIEEIIPALQVHEWSQLWSALTGKQQGDLRQHWLPQIIEKVVEYASTRSPQISLIPAIREISQARGSFDTLSGADLINKLAELQQPALSERENLKKFIRINKFLQSVVDNATARIEIPHTREHVLVEIDGKILPLESLGTGIHEVVMLASFCTILENQVVCIEEPEIHLHPVLQRRLIKYLQEYTSNQYFIATHSASLIDTAGASIFHVRNVNGCTEIKSAISGNERFNVCNDLGYKASDLLQANFIIWVEGPSDRIYINHWIESLDPSLREGIEYSIMFYGGRLLSHLSAKDSTFSDEGADALIELRRLNRNMAVLIDSDKRADSDTINDTKLRIKSEIEKDGGIVWICDGREIENYVTKEAMTAALQEVYGDKFGERYKTAKFDHVLPFKNTKGEIINTIDKVRVAKEVCKHAADLDALNLKEKVNALITKIRAANHM